MGCELKLKKKGSKVPYCSYSTAIKRLTLLKRFFPQSVSVNELSKETGVSRSRHSSELSFLITLNLVERPQRGQYRISERGLSLLDPKNSEDQKKEIIKQTLIEIYHDELIGLFREDEYDRDKFIKIFKTSIGGNWQDYFAQKTFTRFLSFIRFAGYLEGKGSNTVLNVISCTNCDELVNRKAKFCSECGGSITSKKLEQKCPKCGEMINTTWKFCEYCGDDLKSAL